MNDLPWPLVRKGYSARNPWFAVRCMDIIKPEADKPWGVLYGDTLRYFSDDQMNALGGDELNTDSLIQTIDDLYATKLEVDRLEKAVKENAEAETQLRGCLGQINALINGRNTAQGEAAHYKRISDDQAVYIAQLRDTIRSLSIAPAKKPKPKAAVKKAKKRPPKPISRKDRPVKYSTPKSKPTKKPAPKSTKSGKSGKKC